MKLLFACGGSGGHIFPAVAVAEELLLRKPEASVLFVSSGREIENEIFRTVSQYRVVALDRLDKPAPARPLWHPQFLLRLLRETSAAAALLKKEKPAAVVGWGGHGSFPVVLAALGRGIPTLVHEQNVMPGLANRLLAPLVRSVAVSFEGTRLKGKHLRVTGNPIRMAIEKDCRSEAMRFFGFDPDKKTLLILGGSQGAESVNSLFFEALPDFAKEIGGSVQILHLCGRMNAQDSEKRLAQAGIFARAFSFFDRMDLAYAAADMAVGRAGATFLAEMEARQLPAILVPYPFAGGHQLENARLVAARSDAVVVEQKNLNGPKLAALIKERLRSAGAARRGTLQPDPARKKLTDFILETVGTDE